MLDFVENDERFQFFQASHQDNNTSVASTHYQEWVKPTGVNFVYIMCIGAGGGGGGGFSAASGSAKGGGGGGSTGAITKGLFPAIMVPDVLWVSVGNQGASQYRRGPGLAGLVGMGSNVAYRASTYNPYVNLIIAFGGNGGVGGTAAGAAAGGAAPAAMQSAHAPLGFTAGLLYAAGGLAGGAAGTIAPAAAGSITPFSAYVIQPGAGGGSASALDATSFGGGYNAHDTIWPGVPGGGNGPIDGQHGASYWSPIFHQRGGAGGGAHATGQGGNGGDGVGYGCGGGGGGAGVTAGNGGAGGPGLVIIGAW